MFKKIGTLPRKLVLSSLWFVRNLIEAEETKIQFHVKTAKEAKKISEEHLELTPHLNTLKFGHDSLFWAYKCDQQLTRDAFLADYCAAIMC